RKSACAICFNFGFAAPLGFRTMETIRATPGSSRHTRKAPCPTIPLAPKIAMFIVSVYLARAFTKSLAVQRNLLRCGHETTHAFAVRSRCSPAAGQVHHRLFDCLGRQASLRAEGLPLLPRQVAGPAETLPRTYHQDFREAWPQKHRVLGAHGRPTEI